MKGEKSHCRAHGADPAFLPMTIPTKNTPPLPDLGPAYERAQRAPESSRRRQIEMAIAYVQDNRKGALSILRVTERANKYLHALGRHIVSVTEVAAVVKELVERGIALPQSRGEFTIKPEEGQKWRRQNGLKESYLHGKPKPPAEPTPDDFGPDVFASLFR